MKGTSSEYLKISKIRRSVGITAQRMNDIQSSKFADYSVLKDICSILGEDIGLVCVGCEGEITDAPWSKPKKKAAKKPKKAETHKSEAKPKKAKQAALKSKTKSKWWVDIEVVNHCNDHLSLVVSGNKIDIYENVDAPKKISCTILGKTEVYSNGKRQEKLFRETVAITGGD